jgi:hypothetical protein
VLGTSSKVLGLTVDDRCPGYGLASVFGQTVPLLDAKRGGT